MLLKVKLFKRLKCENPRVSPSLSVVVADFEVVFSRFGDEEEEGEEDDGSDGFGHSWLLGDHRLFHFMSFFNLGSSPDFLGSSYPDRLTSWLLS